jgi:Ni/Co efflux regulator RcnB
MGAKGNPKRYKPVINPAVFTEDDMRRLLISVAVLALATAPAFAQPGQEREHGPRGGGPGQGEHGGPGPRDGSPNAAPQMQGTQSRAHVAPPAAAQGGGPTNFTNQIQGHQPDQGQRPEQGQRSERGNWQGRGERGPQAAPQLQAAPQPQATPQQMQRGPNRPDGSANFGNRGDNGRDFRGGDRRPGGPTFNGPRRDYSGFRDFHRDFRSARRFRIAPYRPPVGFYGHRWTFGEFLPRPYWARDYWLMDFADYGLPPPPYGAVWVRVGNDALMIDQDSGEVITVAYAVFY